MADCLDEWGEIALMGNVKVLAETDDPELQERIARDMAAKLYINKAANTFEHALYLVGKMIGEYRGTMNTLNELEQGVKKKGGKRDRPQARPGGYQKSQMGAIEGGC